MPTARPRHQVVETDELAAALDAASLLWPDLSRPELLVELALTGHRALLGRREARLAAVYRHSGSLTGVYEADYIQQLRADWPE